MPFVHPWALAPDMGSKLYKWSDAIHLEGDSENTEDLLLYSQLALRAHTPHLEVFENMLSSGLVW